MRNYYRNLSRNINTDLHTDKNHFVFNDIIPLTAEERVRLDESYRAYVMGLIFGLFDIAFDEDRITGEKRAIYKYTVQEGITVKRSEQLGIENRLIRRLYEEEGRDAIRYKIIKEAEKIQYEFFKRNLLAEMHTESFQLP